MRVSDLERRALGVTAAAVAILALMGGGLDPTPRSDNVPPVADDPAAVPAEPAPVGTAPPGKDAKAATPAKTGTKGEALPWDKKAPVAAKKPEVKKPEVKKPVVTCASVAEDVCRELPACAWLADIPLDDGAVAKAHCTTRTPAVAAKSEAAPSDGAKKSEAKPAAVPSEAKAEVTPAAGEAKTKPAAATGTAKRDQKLPAEDSQTSSSPPATTSDAAGGTKPFVLVPPPATKPAATAPVVPAPASKKSSEETDQNPAP